MDESTGEEKSSSAPKQEIQTLPIEPRLNIRTEDFDLWDLWDLEDVKVEEGKPGDAQEAGEKVKLKRGNLPIQPPEVDVFETTLHGEQDEGGEPVSEGEEGVEIGGGAERAKAAAEARVEAGEQAAQVKPEPRRGMSVLEKAGLGAFCGLILILGGVFYHYTLNRVPKSSMFDVECKMPVAGQYVEVMQLRTYWKNVMTDAGVQYTVKSGTAVIPLVELEYRGARGAIRAVFRDQRGVMIGDLLTHSVNGEGKIELAATAGMAEVGDFSEYRAGLVKPWTIELWEGPSEGANREQFKKMIETRVTSEYR